MASPIPPYAHPGPGPSNYYPQRPPSSPRFNYGGANGQAGPSNAGYQYPYSPHSMHPQGPSSPRINAHGGVPYSSGRGGTHYQQNMQPQHYPHPPHAPNPHYPPQQPMKYPPNYQPQFSPPPPIPYAQAWTTSQPLSPLPKQLSMPPPREPSYYSPTISPSSPNPPGSISPETSVSIQHRFQSVPLVAPFQSPPPPVLDPPAENALTDVLTSPVTTASDEPPADPSLSTSTSSVASVSSSTSTASSGSSLTRPLPTWVIWSRRPQNPSLAPGIIFSPRSKPPPNILAGAMELAIPDDEEPPSEAPNEEDDPPLRLEDLIVNKKEPVSAEDVAPVLELPLVEKEESLLAEDAQSLQSHTTSSQVTETSGTPTANSPVSTNTSLSLAGTPVKEKEREIKPQEEDITPSQPPVVEAPTPTPPTAPAPAPVPPVKKSWASLLKPSGSTSSSGPVRNALPTSSVVGFSIPASATASPTNPQLLSLLSSNPPRSNVAAMKIRPRGLINTGNMCFANSVLQVLLYCPPFFTLFSELGKFLKPRQGGELVDAVMKFLKDFNAEKKKNTKDEEDEEEDEEAFIPSYVYDAMKEKKRFDHMRGGQQEDAEEFFGFLLDTLEEELLALANASSTTVEQKVVEEAESPEENGWMEVGKRNRTVVTRTTKTTESPITRIFGGKFRSTLRAPGQKDSAVVEDWRSLRLDIQREQIHTIQDALSYISHPQPVQMTNGARTVEAHQQVLIDSLPPILVLHMKRFCYDTNVGGVVKVGKQVRFGPELDIGSDILSANAKRQYHNARYRLFGAVYHHGVSASGGHYTLDVLHPNRFPGAKIKEGWVRIDDELVSDVSSEDVFDASERDDTRCPYLLFYHGVR